MAEPVLKKGSNEPAVRDLQEAMKALGHDPGPVDGVFGEATEAAVKAFQQEKGITVDGIVGPETYAALAGARWQLGDRVLALHHEFQPGGCF